ncbi:quinon protein alcohol dehydrogenase-like superfamily, partial [Mycena sp. CBHHK59/15]
SHVGNSEVVDLLNRLSRMISTQLSYSSRCWASHLQEADFDAIVLEELKVLLYNKFLYWLEVLSLLKEVAITKDALPVAAHWHYAKAKQEHDEALEGFVNDAVKFMTVFSPPIAQSAPHIYLSALAFAPRESTIAHHFSSYFPQHLHFLSPQGTHWPGIRKILHVPSRHFEYIGFSSDGARIVCVSNNNTLRTWDAQTGEVLALTELFGKDIDPATSAAVSPDGTRIATGTYERLIHIWDALSGEILIGPLEGHSNLVRCLAFSPDGARIVSGSWDSKVCVWDAAT